MVAVGARTIGRGQVISHSDPNAQTEPGEIYRLELTLDQDASTDEAKIANMIKAIVEIKKEYPAMSVTFVEAQGSKVYVEFFDHPAIPLAILVGLIVAAVIAGLVLAALNVINQILSKVVQIGEQIKEIFPPGTLPFLLALPAIGVGVVIVGYGLNKYFGLERSDYRRAGGYVRRRLRR